VTLRVFRCPSCALSTTALPGSTVSHYCPKNRNRETFFVPQHPDTSRSDKR
jgi:hypothetical protein